MRVAALLAAAAIVGAGLVVPASEVTVVTGHTTFADMNGMDPCLAAVAGIVETEVLWFDGAIFHQRTNFEDDRYIFASSEESGDPTDHVRFDNVSNIEENADDQPADKVLTRSGVWYNFTDPNGVTWNVTEVFWDNKVPKVDGDGGSDSGPAGGSANRNDTAGTFRHYAWIVKIGPTTEDDHMDNTPGHTGRYNFVNMINTCKFSDAAAVDDRREHDAANETIAGYNHPNKHSNYHEHQAWNVTLDIGKKPDLVPLDAEPAHEVTSKTVAEVMQEVTSG